MTSHVFRYLREAGKRYLREQIESQRLQTHIHRSSIVTSGVQTHHSCAKCHIPMTFPISAISDLSSIRIPPHHAANIIVHIS